MKQKGMAYTSFAILASGIILSVIFLSFTTYQPSTPGDETLISQASFNVESIRNDVERAHNIGFENSLAEVQGEILQAQTPVENPEERITEVKVEGEFHGEEIEFMENSSVEGWFERVETAAIDAGHQVDYTLVDAEYEEDPSQMLIYSTLTIDVELIDDATSTKFERQQTVENNATYENLEDTMHRLQTGDFYGHIMTQCGFNNLAEELEEPEIHESSGTEVHGYAVIDEFDEEEDYSENILVTEDPEAYEDEEREEFAAVITVQNTADYEEQQSIVINDDQIWHTNFREMIEERCYLHATNEHNGPTFMERLQGMVNSEENEGLMTLVDKSDEYFGTNEYSNVDHVQFWEDEEGRDEIFNPDGEGPYEISGVSNTDAGTEPVEDFLIDEHHTEYFEIQELTN